MSTYILQKDWDLIVTKIPKGTPFYFKGDVYYNEEYNQIFSRDVVAEHPEWFQPQQSNNRDWEVIAYKKENGEIWRKTSAGKWKLSNCDYPIKTDFEMVCPPYTIHSVKRLSDGEVFTVGDKLDGEYNDKEKFIKGLFGEINSIKKAKQPLFKTKQYTEEDLTQARIEAFNAAREYVYSAFQNVPMPPQQKYPTSINYINSLKEKEMKKTIVILSLILAAVVSTNAQTKDTIVNRFTDTTKMQISLKDVSTYLNQIKDKITVAEAEDFWKVFNWIVGQEAALYNQTQKRK